MVSEVKGEILSDKSIIKIGNLLSKKFIYGGQHNLRVAELSVMLSHKLGLRKSYIDKIYTGALVHDAGKALIPKNILKKKGKLTREEFLYITQHPLLGKRIIYTNEPTYNNIILYHHERYDGTGYPYGLKGKEIPLEAQIVIICDIYDALRSKRPYKEFFTHEKSMDIIKNGDDRTKPQFFNPTILKEFLSISNKIENLYNNLSLND